MRRLIICNDGTWNSPDDKDRGKVKPTNITKIARSILPVDEESTSQIVFYDEGVGTGFGEKFIGGTTGLGLSKNVLQSYQFLSHNYQKGDEIYLFGFSRGAYTSRSLAGLISKIGLVEKDDVVYMPGLYDLYKNKAPDVEVEAFYTDKGIQQHQPRIKMIGVFDTVGALGTPFGGINKIISRFKLVEFQFHDVSLSSIVDHAYQALAIDEQRKPFAPELWTKIADPNTKMEQRWFVGVHSNVGGGYNPDDLANITLKYIVGKAKGCGLAFDDSYLGHYGWNIKTDIRKSMSVKYRLLGKNVRQITLGDESNQIVDSSVYKKMEQLSKYKPKNVPAAG